MNFYCLQNTRVFSLAGKGNRQFTHSLLSSASTHPFSCASSPSTSSRPWDGTISGCSACQAGSFPLRDNFGHLILTIITDAPIIVRDRLYREGPRLILCREPFPPSASLILRSCWSKRRAIPLAAHYLRRSWDIVSYSTLWRWTAFVRRFGWMQPSWELRVHLPLRGTSVEGTRARTIFSYAPLPTLKPHLTPIPLGYAAGRSLGWILVNVTRPVCILIYSRDAN